MYKRGFTLVELSIVMVVIGLLISGVLVAQSMIETARVINFVRQIQQYDVAVANFKTKYNSLPGDSPAMGCVNVSNISTCNNGIIEDGQTSNTSWPTFRTDDFTNEIADFWAQLNNGGLTVEGGGTYSNTMGAGFQFLVEGPIKNAPTISIGKNISIIPYYNRANAFWVNANADGGHFYLVGDFTQSASIWLYSNTYNRPSGFGLGYWNKIPAKAALAIDVKMDDGAPNDQFTVLGGGNTPWSRFNVYNHARSDQWFSPDSAGSPCTKNFRYNMDDIDAGCTLMIRMDGQS